MDEVNTEPNVNEEPQVPTIEELQSAMAKQQEMIDQLTSSKDRVLNESKEYKAKYSKLRTEIDGSEKAKLEESENWKELLEREKNDKFTLQEELKTVKQKTVRSNINFAVSKLASDAYDLDDITSALNPEALQIGEDLTVKGIEDAIREVRERKPHLFKVEQNPGMVSSKPNGTPKNVEFGSLSLEDKKRIAMETAMKAY